ncbi:MAG: SPFH domain-containing protein [Planctomycetota bacterium]
MNSTSNTGTLLTVGADHVSVVIGAFDDSVDVDDAPGMRALTPWLQDAYLVAKSPIEYAMTGNAWKNNNRVPRLAVRSADGSNFWFEDVRIQYAADPDRADEVLRDTGGDFAWHHGTMDAYARAVLRDAFGRYTAEEIVLQENQRDATARAKERLDEVLGMHGLYVIELSTSKPGFPKEYESVVQRRQIAEQEVQKIAQELAQLEASRADRLAKIERDKQRADTTMRSGLAFDLRDARRVALRTRAEADRAFESRVRAGTRLRDEKVSQADALTERYTKEAEGLRARADALRAHGPMAVRRALVDGLSKVQFEIAPHEAPPGAGVAAD